MHLSHTYSYGRSGEQLKATLFVVAVLVTMVVCFILGMLNMNQIILGTELNADGTVEYLCFGSGCESLSRMDW